MVHTKRKQGIFFAINTKVKQQ